MAKTLEYELLCSKSASDLATLVTHKLGDGWQLYGNPVLGSDRSTIGVTYCQAVTKDVTKPVKVGAVLL